MPRKPRLELEPGIAHVYARGNNKQAIFGDDDDRERYLRLLAQTIRHRTWRCLSYCLMNNHVHLVIETRTTNLGAGVGWLHGRYAHTFNRRWSRTGHLFGERYGAVRIASDPQLIAAVRYVARNPVEAGLCRRPEDWPWSSHRALARSATVPWLDADRLFDLFGAYGGDGRRSYAACVDSVFGAPQEPREALAA